MYEILMGYLNMVNSLYAPNASSARVMFSVNFEDLDFFAINGSLSDQ